MKKAQYNYLYRKETKPKKKFYKDFYNDVYDIPIEHQGLDQYTIKQYKKQIEDDKMDD